MFGLTRREQRWKAEQKAVETVAALAAVAIKGATDARVAEAQSQASQDAVSLAAVRQAVLGYYAALDRREHGGVAQDKAFRAIEQALGMQWVQGASRT